MLTARLLFVIGASVFLCVDVAAVEKSAQSTPANESAKTLPTYSDAEAAKHVGEEATVTGKVVAISTSKQGNIYVNLGDRFPKQTFSGSIRAKDAESVGDVKKFEGQTVSIAGKIELYNDKPQIVITSAGSD